MTFYVNLHALASSHLMNVSRTWLQSVKYSKQGGSCISHMICQMPENSLKVCQLWYVAKEKEEEEEEEEAEEKEKEEWVEGTGLLQ